MTSPWPGNLCPACDDFDVVGALLYDRGDQLLEIGPFNYPIDEEECDLCRIARHAIEYQDEHEKHIIQIRRPPNSPPCSILEATRWNPNPEPKQFYGSRWINAARPGDICWTVTREPPQSSSRDFSTKGTALTGYYHIYNESMAVAQTLKWLQACTVDRQCSNPSNHRRLRKSRFFFIDVINDNVVAKKNCLLSDYFALSYVCGGHKAFELTTENQYDLASPGALSNINLPRTYRDAMSFTKLCGIRYLWIDFLCILHEQGVPDQRQIDAMDDVYGKAKLVLIATIGASASFGLYPRTVEAKKVYGLWLDYFGAYAAMRFWQLFPACFCRKHFFGFHGVKQIR